MAISLISPGIKITEQDLVPSNQPVSLIAGATSGQFRWGPVEKAQSVGSEAELISAYGIPNSTNIVDFLSASNFLGYASPLFVVRVANTSLNATAEATTGSGTAGTGTLIKNDDVYLNTASFNVGPWLARYPGALGNGIKVSTCASSAAWQSTLTGTWTVAAGGTVVSGTAGAANTELTVGDLVVIGDRTLNVRTVTNANSFVLTTAHLTGATAATVTRRWEFYNEFDIAPGTTTYGTGKAAVNDGLHIAVVDRLSEFTGTANTVVEKFANLSKGSDARGDNGGTNYYKNVINNESNYIWWAAHDSSGTNWGNTLAQTTYTAVNVPKSYSLAGGSDGVALTDGDRTTGFLVLANASEVPTSIVFTGQAAAATINRTIADVAELRKDIVMCVSPIRTAVVNNAGSEATSVAAWVDTVTRSTYVIADSGWKYQYDKFNDTYVYVPLNGDTAGILARNDANRDPWLSPAGPINGRIQNLVRLAYNPGQTDRDALYKISVNPVITTTGKGTYLFGDKTFTTKTTSLNRINVRRLFIELQRTIGQAADAVLFDANDTITRSGFVNLIVPYLRSVQARRGITAFRVVCDASNNPESVVNANEFVCDIYVQPVRSVNFVQLNFVSVRGGTAFTEIAA
jgi:hypothetical protein